MKTSIRTHEGRVALVTGAGQGIGQAIALALAERGAQVIATDLKLPEETANKIDRERAFFAMFSTMIGAIEIARMLPDPAIRENVLGSARDFLLRSF